MIRQLRMSIRLFENATCLNNAAAWEADPQFGGYYKNILCSKDVKTRQNSTVSIETAYERLRPHLNENDTLDSVKRSLRSPICVLPKGHVGNCSCSPHSTLFSNLPASISGKVETSIYSTPGNDDYVFKNRSNRLFPIMLTGQQESQIRKRTVKLACAIPTRDATTPLMQAGAYIDWITQNINVPEIRANLGDMGDSGAFITMLNHHKIVLGERFLAHRRRLFNEAGNTICPVTAHEIRLEDLESREDSRTRPRPTDVQLGHCIPRSDAEFTIRGFNICMMTREGNRIVGDSPFCSDEWVNNLRAIIKFQDY